MRQRILWAAGGVALVALGGLLYRALLMDLPAVTHNAGDRPENLVPLFQGRTLGQSFTPPATNLSAIELLLQGPSGQRLNGTVTLRIRRDQTDARDLRTAARPVTAFRRGAHTRFAFQALDTRQEERLVLSLEYPEGTKERPLLVRTELPRPDGGPRDDYRDGAATVNGNPIDGDLAFRLLTRGRLPFGTQVAGAAVIGGAALLLGAAARRAPMSAALLTLGVGLPLVFTLPLLQNPLFLGAGDWDMNTTLHAAAFRSLVTERMFPGWNPSLCGGTPLAGFPESPVFSPFFGTVLLGGPIVGFKINIMLHAVLGFLGMLVFLRHGFKTSWLAAFLGAATVCFSSFLALHLFAGHSRKVAYAWIPWVLYFLQRAWGNEKREQLRYAAPAAAMLALMFLDGSVYLSLLTSAFVFLIGLLTSLMRRRWQPAAAGCLTIVLAGLLAGIHLVPITASQDYLSPALTRPDRTLPVRSLIDVFLDPNQNPHSEKFAAQPLPWFEYGAYVGLAPVALALVGAVFSWRRASSWTLAGALFLAVSFAPQAQAVVQHIPVLGDLRNPQRMVALVVVVIGILAALGLDRLRHWLSPPGDRSAAVTGALAVLVALATGHLVFVNTETFAATFRMPPPPAADEPFAQGWAETRFEGPNTFVFTMANSLRNRGSINRCSVAGVQPSGALRLPEEYQRSDVPREFKDRPYTGEAFFIEGDGTARVEHHHTADVVVAYQTAAPRAVLALNQNYHQGWTAKVSPAAGGDGTERPVFSAEGVAAVELERGSGSVRFSYAPPGLGLGALASAIGFAASAAVWILGTKRAAR